MPRRPGPFAASIFALLLVSDVAAQTPLFTYTAAGTSAGTSLSGLGDVDGDGIPDFVVGAPTTPGGGAAVIFSGAPGHALLRTLTGAGGEFGFAVVAAPDLDGDGRPDVLVGAPSGTASGSAVGEARILSSATGALLRLIVPPAGGGAYYRFGSTVANVGDVNLDLVPDLLVGSLGAAVGCGQNNQCGASIVGRAAVYSGSTGGLLQLTTLAAGERFVSAAGAAGDLNGDGRADWFVTSNGNVPFSQVCGLGFCTVPYHSASLRVLSGATGGAIWNITGGPASVAAASIGDLNGDGKPDLVVAFVALLPNNPGSANMFLGVYSGATGLELASRYEPFVIGGYAAGDVESAVLSTGDLDGDGVPDFALGSPARNIVRFISGASLETLYTLGGGPAQQFGRSLAAIGDLDGDGVSEVAMGAAAAGFVQIISPRLGPIARVQTLGTICPDGLLAPLLGSSLARPGSTVRLVVSESLFLFPIYPTLYMALGVPPASPLFVGAGPSFGTACALHLDPVSAFLVATTTMPTPPWSTDIGIPADPGLNGVVVIAQVLAVVNNGAALSNGLRITVGP